MPSTLTPTELTIDWNNSQHGTSVETAKQKKLEYLEFKLRHRLETTINEAIATELAIKYEINTPAVIPGVTGQIVTEQISLADMIRYRLYLQNIIDGYGGLNNILSTLENSQADVSPYSLDDYFDIKGLITSAESEGDVKNIKLCEIPIF